MFFITITIAARLLTRQKQTTVKVLKGAEQEFSKQHPVKGLQFQTMKEDEESSVVEKIQLTALDNKAVDVESME